MDIIPPCKDCPVLAMCKHRYYEDLIFKCFSIARYLSVYDQRRVAGQLLCEKKLRLQHRARVRKVVKILNPTKWEIGEPSMSSYSGGYDIILLEVGNGRVYWGTTFF